MKITKKQFETSFERDLDPYAETRIFPGYWDLSELPEQLESQTAGSQYPQERDHTLIDHGLAPGAMDEWHLAAYFEEHLARLRRWFSAF